MRPGRLGTIARKVVLAAAVVALAALTPLVGFVVRHRDARGGQFVAWVE